MGVGGTPRPLVSVERVVGSPEGDQPAVSRQSVTSGGAQMSEHRLARRVNDVADRIRKLRRHRRMSWIWLLSALLAALLAVGQFTLQAAIVPTGPLAAAVVLLVAFGIVVGFRARASAHEAAVLIERQFPDLDSRLLTAMEQRPDGEIGGYRFLQHEIISDTLLHAHRHDWSDSVPSGAMARARMRNVAALCLLGVGVVAVGWTASGRPPMSALRAKVPDLQEVGSLVSVVVEPGDASVERGTSLLVMATFGQHVPHDVTLVATDGDGGQTHIPLSRSLDDPVFGGRIPQVTGDLTYRVEFDGQSSDEYRVEVFEFPELLQADATVRSPQYTGLSEKTIEDVRRVSIVEGSEITILCQLNKPVVSAQLEGEDLPEGLTLTTAEDPSRVSATWVPTGRQTLELHLVDEAGRENRFPPTFVIDVLPNNPPDLKIAFPARDTRVSPLEELALEAKVWDDFGLREFGLVYQTPAGDEHRLTLGEGSGGEEQHDIAHLMEFEGLGAEPLQLVSYYFYADDIGPGGNVRRTFSDMYFAEVRHLEEIFRQNMQSTPPGQQQQQQPSGGQQMDELVQLQRQIVNATWNLIRRETRPEPSAEYADDLQTIAESQQQAIELAAAQQAEVEDAQSRQHLQQAVEHMTSAADHFGEAAGRSAVAPLPDARQSAQAAYRSLLQLQAREHQVRQSQPGSSSSQRAGQQQRQQQLNNLELKDNRSRYETESQDQSQQAADREQLQVLNRLSELAQRQQDVNEKLKELEAALRMAQSDKEREDIERQLKRLREEQQELLRDLDEVQERMNQQENRQQMSDAREQLEQTREQLRNTTEALEQGQLSRAMTSGTRAERELKQLEQDFRDQASHQFSEVMREMREEARELSERQQQLADQLNGRSEDPPETDSRRPSLRDDSGGQPELESGFAEQQQKLTDLMQQMEQVIREAETSEPLLSKKLYDAIRQSRIDQPEESLAMTTELLRRGFQREAAEVEQQASEGINKLREGVEEAAENVLGNELEALSRARAQLERLSRSLGEELAAADPPSASDQGDLSGQPGYSSQPRSAEARSERPQESRSGQPGSRPTGESPDERDASEGSQQPGGSDPRTSVDQPRDSEGRAEPSRSAGSQQQSPRQTNRPGKDRRNLVREHPARQPVVSSRAAMSRRQRRDSPQGAGNPPEASPVNSRAHSPIC